jgi:23S rRNA (cytosine1962-C5)-methyltransferase
MTRLPVVEINSKAAERIRGGHVWVFGSDIKSAGEAVAGDVVEAFCRHSSKGTNSLGLFFFNPASMIVLRLIERRVIEPTEEFWKQRLLRAIRFRDLLRGRDTACRLVYSEADGLPGLIVDQYADVLVMQTLCAGADRQKELFADLLEKQFGPRAIVERNEGGVRKLEGLGEKSGVLRGKLEGLVEVDMGGLRLKVDPIAGQKTGAYLDQRENQKIASHYAHGRCLDAFSYQGGFGLQLLAGGAEEVLAVDQSESALEMARTIACENSLEDRFQVKAGNVFDCLRQMQEASERFDVVVLDPPAFAKSRASVPGAIRGYKEINLRAMRLLREGGILITSSCSYHMSPDRFEVMLHDSAKDAGKVLQVLERRSQASDHPERMGFPESRYLKCMILRVL